MADMQMINFSSHVVEKIRIDDSISNVTFLLLQKQVNTERNNMISNTGRFLGLPEAVTVSFEPPLKKSHHTKSFRSEKRLRDLKQTLNHFSPV